MTKEVSVKNLRFYIAMFVTILISLLLTVPAQAAQQSLPKNAQKGVCSTYAEQFNASGNGYWEVKNDKYRFICYATDGAENYYEKSFFVVDKNEYYAGKNGWIYVNKATPDGRKANKYGIVKAVQPAKDDDTNKTPVSGGVSQPKEEKKVGFYKESGSWYLYQNGEKLKNGVFTYGKYDYYLSWSGIVQTGWQSVNGSLIYCSEDPDTFGRIIKNDFVKIKDSWYFFDSTGCRQTGWVIVGGDTYYYFDSTGQMAVGSYWIDGVSYMFSSTSGTLGQLTSKVHPLTISRGNKNLPS